MDESSIIDYISTTFDGVEVVEAAGDSYFMYDPDRMHPFATLVTGDRHDQVSDLERPGVFRLNIGVGKQTFNTLFGQGDGDYDFAALDTLMPHPVYGNMHWVCVLNPGAATFQEQVAPLLAEAYERDVARIARRKPNDKR